MSQFDLNQIVNDKITDDGIQPITVGAVICAQAREQFRSLLRAAAPERYEEYRSVKYPSGSKESATPETRLAATRFLFDAARDLLAPHYVSTAE